MGGRNDVSISRSTLRPAVLLIFASSLCACDLQFLEGDTWFVDPGPGDDDGSADPGSGIADGGSQKDLPDDADALTDGSALPALSEVEGSEVEGSDGSDGAGGPDGAAPACPFGQGLCVGGVFHACDPVTMAETVEPCDSGWPCLTDVCVDGLGCIHLPKDGAACDDGDACTTGDTCQDALCLSGAAVACAPGYACTKGACECTATCGDKTCGQDLCGNTCGQCAQWQKCEDGQCADFYPAAPWGPFPGNVLPNLTVIDPATSQEAPFADFYQDGKLLLITFSTGWCLVCKNDTQLFNAWHQAYGPAGLRIVEIMYETAQAKPITESFALMWKQIYGIQYSLLMDSPTTGPDGKTQGGALAYFQMPAGPIKKGTFPTTIVVCPQTMKIIYIKVGFYEEEVAPLVMQYLFGQKCG